MVNECNDSRTNDCDKNADCLDLPGGYTCRCKANFRDVSPNANRSPGRKCVTGRQNYAESYTIFSVQNFLIIISVVHNECGNKSDNDCHQFATCSDLTDGYQCRCKEGFVDVSTDSVMKPGRDCKQSNLRKSFKCL